jgi:hypothetical protein
MQSPSEACPSCFEDLPMPLRLKKMLGSLFICCFVLFWMWFALGLAHRVPHKWYFELPFYAVIGLGWAVPVMPILYWMEKTKAPNPAMRRKS